MAVRKFLDSLEAVMAFLALVFVSGMDSLKKTVVGRCPWSCANDHSLLLILGTDVVASITRQMRCSYPVIDSRA